ncbi:MAG TPA: response regulator [Gemmatimonadaceae bacterium]|jgi:FixJ family two-component response regulator|nr:response regulator [Gemmatimonadaceae bacterium]
MMTTPRLSIAIVDDEECVRVGMRRLCNALGLMAAAYGSGLEFIDSLDAGGMHPDCLLLDAHMPDMTGLEVQQHLVTRSARFPTIVYTADDAPEAQARYLAAGAAEYLRKPIGGDELLAAIARALGTDSPVSAIRDF